MSTSSNAADDGGPGGFKVYGSLFKVESRYELLNPLGKGSYGIVCAAKDRETGQRLAIKKVCPMAKRSSDAKHTLREMLLLQLLGRHPNIIAMHNLSTNVKDDELYIVMDLMDTDLHRVIQSSQALTESHVKYFLHQLLRGVKYLHDNGVLHRDLKPGNLLLTKTCQLKIADFGLARKVPKLHGAPGTTGNGGLLERPRSAPAASVSSSSKTHGQAPMTEHVVTRWYRAPELMLQPDGYYDESVDMWSVGCIFAEILGRKALFPGKNFLQQLTLIFDVIGTPPPEAATKVKSSQAQRFLKSLGKKPRVPFSTLFPNASTDALDLLERLLEFDPEKRITAHEALLHPFMQPIEKKYKGVDPHPSARVDFSFDSNKKLTKMDLKTLILKEVEAFRRSVTHRVAADIEADPSMASKSTSKPVASGDDPKHPTAPSATTTALHATPQPRVMCGSAGISMIHSMLRQRSECNAEAETSQDVTGSATSRHAAFDRPTSAMIGSSRPRIRMNTKPPVPKQPAMFTGTTGNDPQDHVRVVSATESKTLLISDTTDEGRECASRPSANEAQVDKVNPVDKSVANDAVCSRSLSDAVSALEERAKTLMGSMQAQWAAPAAKRMMIGDADPAQSPSSPAMSSSSSSSSDATNDFPTAHFHAAGHQTARAEQLTDSVSTALPRRRVASAGPVRMKPSLAIGLKQATIAASNTTNNTIKTPNQQSAFAGSAASLPRAQRSNSGQPLAASTDKTVSSVAVERDLQEPVREGREEVGAPALRTQRSTTQLNNQQEPVGLRRPTKKLTVPKSPKFSVMSWQKKKETIVDPLVHVISRR